MKISFIDTKLEVKYTNQFNEGLKKVLKQGKDLSKIKNIVNRLANNEKLELKYRNHRLVDNKYYKDCFECHIEPDCLLVYQYINEDLVLLLINIGSHSDIF